MYRENTGIKETDDEAETKVFFGLIMRLPIEQIPELKRLLLSVDGLEIVYNRVSADYMWIRQEGREVE